MEGKVAVLGSADFVMPFTALGLDTFVASEEDAQTVETAKKIVDEKYALVVIAENIAPVVQEIFDAVQRKTTPCVVIVPFTTESEGFAIKSLSDVLRMATGIDIMHNS